MTSASVMSKVQRLPSLKFLSELYAQDAPDAVLLAEYPSSNSDETQFQNRSKYIIYDPFPPPTRALLKVLGPHHLMWLGSTSSRHIRDSATEAADRALAKYFLKRRFPDCTCSRVPPSFNETTGNASDAKSRLVSTCNPTRAFWAVG